MNSSNIAPELNNGEEIEGLLSSDLQAKRDIGMGKALQNVTLGIVNGRLAITGMSSNIKTASNELEKLNSNIKTASNEFEKLNLNIVDSSKSSEKLTKAIKNITLWGTIIAGIGVLIALSNLVLEFYKMLKLGV
jgi:chromosome segregation ATPase